METNDGEAGAEVAPTPPAPPPPRTRFPRIRFRLASQRVSPFAQAIGKITLAHGAFLLSVVLALINLFYAVRGAEMVVQPPEQVLVFRDGTGADSVLTFAMRVAMINAAGGENGDVLMKAEIGTTGSPVRWQSAGEVQPVFVAEGASAGEGCPTGSRCITHPGLTVIETTGRILDIPGGQVRATYLTYPVAAWNCTGEARRCAALGNFDTALAGLSRAPIELAIRLSFYGDGERSLRCAIDRIDAAYLRDTGWAVLNCRTASASGTNWF